MPQVRLDRDALEKDIVSLGEEHEAGSAGHSFSVARSGFREIVLGWAQGRHAERGQSAGVVFSAPSERLEKHDRVPV